MNKQDKNNIIVLNDGTTIMPTVFGVYKLGKFVFNHLPIWIRSDIKQKVEYKLACLKNSDFANDKYIVRLASIWVVNKLLAEQDCDLAPYKAAMLKMVNKMAKTPDELEVLRYLYIELGYTSFVYDFTNYANATVKYFTKYANDNNQTQIMFKHNLSRLGCCYFKKSFFKSIVSRCECCGEIFIDQTKLTSDMAKHISYRDYDILGVDGYCSDCAENNGYRRCDCCRLWGDEYDDWYYVENTEETICSDCRDNSNYHECEECGNLIDTDESGDWLFTDDDCFYCSADCAYDAGYHYSEDRDEWTQENEVDELFDEYHQNRDFEPIGVRDNRMKHNLMGGTEVELDGRSRNDDYDFWVDMQNDYNDIFNFTKDSSVECELVSKPMFEKNFASFDWEKFCKRLSEQGYRSHDTTTCGLHFHFSSWYLGYNQNQKVNSAKKLIRFFQNNKNDLVKLSRRKIEQVNHWCCINTNNLIDKHTIITGDLKDRYNAVNICNLDCPDFGLYGKIDTIEIRLARGTLNPNTLLATWKIWLTLVRNSKKISWKNIDNLDLWFKGLDQRAIDYMKSRGCFADYVAAHQVLDTGENYCEE